MKICIKSFHKKIYDIFRTLDKQSIYIYIEGDTEEGREISGEHDNISENLRILLIICILHGIQMSLMIALLFEVDSLIISSFLFIGLNIVF